MANIHLNAWLIKKEEFAIAKFYICSANLRFDPAPKQTKNPNHSWDPSFGSQNRMIFEPWYRYITMNWVETLEFPDLTSQKIKQLLTVS